MNRNAQSTLEFLITYGWAVLSILLVVGILVYWGVFSPKNSVSPTGLVSAPFQLGGFSIVNDEVVGDQIVLGLVHNLGVPIRLNSQLVIGSEGFSFVLSDGTSCSADEAVGFPDVLVNSGSANFWNSGFEVLFVLDCGDSWSSGDVVAGDLIIRYYKRGSSLLQVSRGGLKGFSG